MTSTRGVGSAPPPSRTPPPAQSPSKSLDDLDPDKLQQLMDALSPPDADDSGMQSLQSAMMSQPDGSGFDSINSDDDDEDDDSTTMP